METFAQKKEEKEEPIEKEAAPPKFLHLLDEDQVEIKRLDSEDLDDSLKVMRKCAFDVTLEEVEEIVDFDMSFGAHVNRMIIGVGLSWPAYLDYETKKISGDEPNALYIEDPAVLLAYEGRGIRRMLLREREKEAKSRGYQYTMAYLYEDLPRGDIVDMIKEAGSQLEKLFLSEDYEFHRTEKGILTIKRL